MNGNPAQGVEAQPTNTIIPENKPQAENSVESIAPETFIEQQNPTQQTEQQPQTQETIKPNIVDMRTGHEKLDDVSPNADKITSIADEEEEEFIEEVNRIHGSGSANI